MTSRTSSGSPTRSRSRAPASCERTPASLRWRTISSMKNGLPSVSRYSAWTKASDGVPPDAQAHELHRLGLGQAADVELDHEPLAAQAGQRGVEALAPLVDVAVGAHDRHARVVGGARQVAQEQQRRAVGPLQVVEHDQHRHRRRDLGQQPGHRLEQPVAVGLGVAGIGRGQLGHAAAQLGDEPAQLGAVLPGDDAQLLQRRAEHVVAQRLQERLVGHEGLLGRAAGEHDRPGGERAHGGLGQQPRLADPRVAGQEHRRARIRPRRQPALPPPPPAAPSRPGGRPAAPRRRPPARRAPRSRPRWRRWSGSGAPPAG